MLTFFIRENQFYFKVLICWFINAKVLMFVVQSKRDCSRAVQLYIVNCTTEKQTTHKTLISYYPKLKTALQQNGSPYKIISRVMCSQRLICKPTLTDRQIFGVKRIIEINLFIEDDRLCRGFPFPLLIKRLINKLNQILITL